MEQCLATIQHHPVPLPRGGVPGGGQFSGTPPGRAALRARPPRAPLLFRPSAAAAPPRPRCAACRGSSPRPRSRPRSACLAPLRRRCPAEPSSAAAPPWAPPPWAPRRAEPAPRVRAPAMELGKVVSAARGPSHPSRDRIRGNSFPGMLVTLGSGCSRGNTAGSLDGWCGGGTRQWLWGAPLRGSSELPVRRWPGRVRSRTPV